MDVVLVNGRVMTERGLEDGLAVRLRGNCIVGVGPTPEQTPAARQRDLRQPARRPWLARGAPALPGLVFDVRAMVHRAAL